MSANERCLSHSWFTIPIGRERPPFLIQLARRADATVARLAAGRRRMKRYLYQQDTHDDIPSSGSSFSKIVQCDACSHSTVRATHSHGACAAYVKPCDSWWEREGPILFNMHTYNNNHWRGVELLLEVSFNQVIVSSSSSSSSSCGKPAVGAPTVACAPLATRE